MTTYVVNYADPNGGASQVASIECDRMAIDPDRNTLQALAADNTVLAAWVGWFSFVPDGSVVAPPPTP